VPTPKFPFLRRPSITPQCYTLSPQQDTSPVCGAGCSDGVRRTVEAGGKAVGDVCAKIADGCSVSSDWEREGKHNLWSVNGECVCTTGDECGTESDEEDNEHDKADGGDDDINTEGHSCVVLGFNVGTETVDIGDAKVVSTLGSNGRDTVPGETGR
jgi:hypothetical protein